MAIALVSGQVISGISGFSVSPLTIALPNNPATGNFVVVGVTDSGSGTLTVADSASNSYTATAATPFVASAGRYGLFFLPNAPANANKTISISVGTPNAFITAFAAEFSGVTTASPFEREGSASFGGANTNINTPSITTTNNGDLLFCVAQGYNTISSANSPWIAISTTQGNTWAEYYIQSTAGAQAVDFTQASSTFWDAMSAAFTASAGAGFVPYNPWPQAAPVLSQ